MSPAPFRVEFLSGAHDREGFNCGEDILDQYLRLQASQDVRRRVAHCFAVVETATGVLAAYYTLSAASVAFTDLRRETSKRLPRYPAIPAVRIGRLAVDLRFQGRGLGGAMLADAAERALRADAAAFMLIVDAMNDQAVSFYRRHGFQTLTGQTHRLFLPLANAREALLQGKRGQR